MLGDVAAPTDAPRAGERMPRWLVVLAWSGGPAALYALLGLLHAAAIERNLSLDVGFGRSLGFWVAASYLALPLWGFLPSRPTGGYARRGVVVGALLLGALGALVCGGLAVAWSIAHWSSRVGGPVLASLLALAAAVGLTLWLVGRDEEPGARTHEPGGTDGK